MRVVSRSVAVVALLLLLSRLSFAGEYSDIKIVSQNSSGLVFTYQSDSVRWVTDPEGDYPRLSHTAVNRLPGFPPLPGRIVYIALPPECPGIQFELVSTGALSEGSHPFPLSTAGTPAVFPYPSDHAVLDQILTIRGLRVARIMLHPLVFQSAEGRYTLAASMTIRVGFQQGRGPVAPPSESNPADPFAAICREILLNPDQAASWRGADQLQLAKLPAETDPFAGSDHWVALSVREGGITRVTPADLQKAGVDVATLNPASFRVFAGPGRALSTRMSDPAPLLSEIPIAIQDGGDGHFNGSDEFEFYTLALNRWEMAPNGRLVDVVNRYTRDNVYWLALDGSFASPARRMTSVSATPLPPPAPEWASARSRARHERDQMLRVDNLGYVSSYYTWYWQNVRRSPVFPYAAIDADPGTRARWEIGAYAARVALNMNGAPVSLGSFQPNAGEDGSSITSFGIASFEPLARFDVEFDSSASGNYYLDYYSIDYNRRLSLASGPIAFAAPDTSAAFNLVLSDTALPAVWDVTDPINPVALEGLVRDGSAARFAVDQSGGSRHVYYAFEPSQRRSPAQVRRATRTDLYQPLSASDYLVIGPRAFQSASASFMSMRASKSGLRMRYVSLEDVYDAFSFGVTDPVAIRRFLRHTYLAWPRPAPVYALLMGDGSYDFLDNTGFHSANLVPPYIALDDNSAADENFVYFGDKQVLNTPSDPQSNPFPDMLIGRWPVKTVGQIEAVTAKISRYESTENLGAWRSRSMLVADDEFGDRTRGSVEEDFHTRDAESIARSHIPPRLDLQKVYMVEYPFSNPGCQLPNASGCRKPSVNDAIITGLNNGILMFDYLGHGNKDLFAHEHVFERSADLPRLTNAGMPAAFLTFSCSIGFFDDPGSEGMSEDLLRMPDAGAVAVVSATRLVTAGANAALNEKVFDLLFSQNMTGIGTALYAGKLLRQYFANCTSCDQIPCPCPNDRRYALFGDPAMKLGIPGLRVNFASVQPETLSALALTNVSGTIIDSVGGIQNSFDGTLTVTVRDAPRHRVYSINDRLSVDYDLAGGTIYRGDVVVSHGQFNFGFMVPKDIAYGRRGALILGHAVSSAQMASGATDSLWLAGSTGTIADTSGPQIALATADGLPVVDGAALPLGAELLVSITDTSGINLTASPGHGIEVFLDDNDRPFADLTGDFHYTPGEFRRGTAALSLASVALGTHKLRFKAWDNANNSSEEKLSIEIAENPAFQVSEFLNYPNPFSGRTTFYFRPSVDDAAIRIFTLTGRMIRFIDSVRDGETSWDGTDQQGDPVGNGVYLAQIELNGRVFEAGRSVDKKAYKETKVVVSR